MLWEPRVEPCPIWDQVVDLGPFPDPGLAHGAPVDAGVGAHLHVVLQNHHARLDHLEIAAVLAGSEAESVASDDGAVLEDHAVAQAAVLPDHGVGMGHEVVADAGVGIDDDIGVDHGVAAHSDPVSDDRVGPPMEWSSPSWAVSAMMAVGWIPGVTEGGR